MAGLVVPALLGLLVVLAGCVAVQRPRRWFYPPAEPRELRQAFRRALPRPVVRGVVERRGRGTRDRELGR